MTDNKTFTAVSITEEQIKKIAINHQKQMGSVRPGEIVETIENAIKEALEHPLTNTRGETAKEMLAPYKRYNGKEDFVNYDIAKDIIEKCISQLHPSPVSVSDEEIEKDNQDKLWKQVFSELDFEWWDDIGDRLKSKFQLSTNKADKEGKKEEGWINIKERLPEHKQQVWIGTKTGATLPSIYYNNQSFVGFYPFTNFYENESSEGYYNKVDLQNKFENVLMWKPLTP